MTIILVLLYIVYGIQGQYTVINGTWTDDFAYDASGIIGWTDNQQAVGDITQSRYHGDYSSNNLEALERYFQCAYNSIAYISFSISFDCNCDTTDWIRFLINNVEQAQYDNTELTTLYEDQGGNQCSGNWYRFDSPTFNIPNITSSDVFHVQFHIQTQDGSNKSPQILIWNIAIQCYFISSSPTSNPSKSPSLNPSTNPTRTPTQNPTQNPSFNPSHQPTINPTISPSENPTKYPTKFPTTSPTDTHTLNPSETPTTYPTDAPTIFPTATPISEGNQISTTINTDKTTVVGDTNDEMSTTGSSNSSLEIIVGVIGGAALILCCMFIVFLFYRERSRKEIRKQELTLQMETMKMQHTTIASTSVIGTPSANDIDTKELQHFNVNLNPKNTYNALPATPITPETGNANEGTEAIADIVPLPPQPMVEGNNNHNITPGDDMYDDSDENEKDQHNQTEDISNNDIQEDDMDDMYKSVVTVGNGE